MTKQQQAKVQIAEAINQDGLLFTERVKMLLANQKSSTTLKGINLVDILYDFKHGKAYNSLSSHYQNKVPRPHACAATAGLISIDDSHKPYSYKLIKQQDKAIILRPYQVDIIERADSAKTSVLVELPTGGGKSVIAKEIIKRETDKGGIVLIVAPKITLLDQLANTFSALNPQIIHGKTDYDSSHNVFVSTLQTAHKRDLGFTPTMILIDEVHFGFSGKMIKQLLKDFIGKLVGLSATPYDKQGKPLEGFGTHLHDYNLMYMIENGYLVPPISYTPVKVDLKGIRTTAGDYNQSDLDAKFNNIESVMQVVDSTKEMIQQRKQTLVFGITIKHAIALADAYSEAGIKAKPMHSQMTKEEQAETMAAFKRGDLQLLTNPDMLTTGFDHPPADTVVLARATKSQNLYKQMVGRVLRLSEGKANAVLLDCAGVISDLGLPTEPIKEKCSGIEFDTKKKQCGSCGSTRIYRRVKRDQAQWVCAECGVSETIEEQVGYECESCGVIHGRDATFTALEDKLFMKCGCGWLTLVSEATTHDELKAIFDSSLIETIQRRTTAIYCTWLINKYGTDMILREDVRKQIAALSEFIKQEPQQAAGTTLESIDKAIGKTKGDWRLLAQRFEADLLPVDTKALEADFYSARRFREAINSLNVLLKAQDQEPLKEWVVSETMQQLRVSTIDGIEAMAVKRLKNLRSKGKDCNSIDAFIPYIEKQRG